jgi:DNA-binding transcriptional regulator of glucitol operon
MKYIIAILFLFAATAAFAQDKPLVQFSGVVHNADSTDVIIPYVTIANTAAKRVVDVANYQGYFSFVVQQGDTLRFTCVGYAPATVVIPSGRELTSYTVQIMLHPQIINLPTFKVFPWATTDEFKKDFLRMKVADDDLEIARKNVTRASLAAIGMTLARDGVEIQSANAQEFNNDLMNQHSLTPNPLLNPIAWGSLINMISQGDRSRQANGD